MIYSLIINGSDEVISFSSVTDFTENLTATVTAHETEVGFPVSDNVVLSNPEFSISGVFSYYNSTSREIVLENGEFVVREFGSESNPVESHVDIEKKIRNVFESKQPFSIVKSTNLHDITGTEVDRIVSCVMRGLTFNTTADRHGAVFPTMQIVQVRQAVVTEESVPNAIPQIVPYESDVATNTTVNQSTETDTNNEPNQRGSDKTLAEKKVSNESDSAMKDAVERRNNVNEQKYQELAAKESAARLLDQNIRARAVFINGSWQVVRE